MKYLRNSKATAYSDKRLIFPLSHLKHLKPEVHYVLSLYNVFRTQQTPLALTSPSDDPHRSNLVSSKLEVLFYYPK